MKMSGIKSIISKVGSGRTSLALLFVFALGFAFLAVPAASAAANNLLRNSSFERDNNGDGIPQKWVGTNLFMGMDKRTCKVSKAGSCSFVFIAPAAGKVLSQTISVPEGQLNDRVKPSVWTKAKNLAGNLQIYIAFKLGGAVVYDGFFTAPSGTTSWTLTEWEIGNPIGPYDTITVELRFGGDSGKLWVDKVMLVPVP